jgi:hypothetical protein
MLFKKSLVLVCLLTMFIILSLDTSNRLYNILLEPINAQSSIDSIRGVQNGTAVFEVR